MLACFIVLLAHTSFVTALTQTLSYDANGNLVGDGEFTYVYDDANQLKEVRRDGSVIAAYTYDETGERIKKVEDGTTTYYIGDTEVRVEGGRTEATNYVKAGGMLVAKQNSSGTYFILTDHLGSVDKILDSNGNIVEDINYMPYGSSDAVGRTYTGKIKDASTGLYYYGARYYNPATTRFTQPDTVIPDVYNPQDLNRYTYVRNNPLIYIDPDGKKARTAAASLTINAHIPIGPLDDLTKDWQISLSLGHAMVRADNGYLSKGLIITKPTDEESVDLPSISVTLRLGDYPKVQTIKEFTEGKTTVYGEINPLIRIPLKAGIEEIYSNNEDGSTDYNEKIGRVYYGGLDIGLLPASFGNKNERTTVVEFTNPDESTGPLDVFRLHKPKLIEGGELR